MKKWIFRLLTLFAAMCALGLFGLKIISGTSDSHKRGLEQAFSQIFKGTATFGELKTFNLIPQFTIEVKNLQISRIKNIGNLSAENMIISFGPIDLATKNRRIENFHLKNFKLTEGTYTPLALHLSDFGIYPNEKNNTASLSFTGTYGSQDLKGQFAMAMTKSIQHKYFFLEENDFTINLGAFQMNGLFNPYSPNGSTMSHISMFAETKAGKIECILPPEKSMELADFIEDVLGAVSEIKAPTDLKKLCDSLNK